MRVAAPLPAQALTGLDWILIAAYFVVALALALAFTRRAGKSTAEFFTSGKSAPWWLAGISMVATTFAADTPLAVTGLVAEGGVVANWFWWSLAMSVMATVFIYAKLWRRVGVLTDVEFAEVRYSGPPAAFLRGFRALYLGLLMNGIILGWVTLGMKTVIEIFLENDAQSGGGLSQALMGSLGWLVGWIPVGEGGTVHAQAAWVILIILYVLTGLYALLGGLWAVMVVDLYQFFIAIGMAIVLAVVAVNSVGGFEGLQEGLTARYGDQAALYTNALPRPVEAPDYSDEQLSALGWSEPPSAIAHQFISPAPPEGTEVAMPSAGAGQTLFFAFLVFIGVQWWSVWYPGHEPGGGGYIAQRILSAKDEKNSLLATLLFSICHFALRPWPWVIVGLVCLISYQGNALFEDNPNRGYAMAMFDLLGPGALGLMLVSFLAAFMSTISTQINWGSSYVVNDFYQRFLRPQASQRHLVRVSRVVTALLILMGIVVSTRFERVEHAWLYVMGLGAGTGLVYMLRWFWWRINAWTEIAAMTSSLVIWVGLDLLNGWLEVNRHLSLNEPTRILITVLASSAIWIMVTTITRPTDREKLCEFYRRARPGGLGWGPIAREVEGVEIHDRLKIDIANWILGCALIYGVLFGTWKVMLGMKLQATVLLLVGVVAAAVIFANFRRHGFKTFAK